VEIQPRASLFASRVTPAPRRTPQTGPALNVKVSARRAGLRSHSQFVIGAEEVTNPRGREAAKSKSGTPGEGGVAEFFPQCITPATTTYGFP
jgi:hypothetical protein